MIRPVFPLPKSSGKEMLNTKSGEKTSTTEKRLQEFQKKLRDIFKVCGWKTSTLVNKGEDINVKQCCLDCKDRPCNNVITQIHLILEPYATSIYKRHFKYRSTLEEMHRVISEAIDSLLMDIWERGKIIRVSFGKMVYWKMMHFLDGKINLFDKDSIQSLDQMKDEFETDGPTDDGEDVIEFYSSVFKEHSNFEGYRGILKKDSIMVIRNIMEYFYFILNRYLNSKFKYAIYLRAFIGVKRFLQGKDNKGLFDKNPKAFYYYNKLLDAIFNYLGFYAKKTKGE